MSWSWRLRRAVSGRRTGLSPDLQETTFFNVRLAKSAGKAVYGQIQVGWGKGGEEV